MRSVEPYTRVVCTGNQNNADRFGAEDWSGSTWTDAAYIAAADPDTIAALLADYDRLQRELEFIAYANPSRWDADMRGQFQEWAQNRARAALADGEES